MTEQEREVLQAAFDLVEAQHALDCGSPAQGMLKRAMTALMDSCDEIASNNDGELRLSDCPPVAAPKSILQELYDLEINAEINWFWDGGFHLALGDCMNGVKSRTNVDTWAEAEIWFREEAAKHWPGCADALDKAEAPT